MKNQIIIAAAATALLGLTGCNQETEVAPKEVTLDTIEKKVSYIVGYNNAKQAKADNFTIDADATAKAINDLYSDAEPMLNEEEMRATMIAFQTQIQEKRQERYTVESEDNLKAGQAFLAENGKREGVVTTESGLQYEVVQAGAGESPSTTDRVSVNYSGTLINGDVFDANDGVQFVVGQLIPGWVEALPLMKTGGKWKLYIPSELAYGPGGSGKIGPNSALIFEMELLSIEKAEAEAAE